jgi:hypothetical protein
MADFQRTANRVGSNPPTYTGTPSPFHAGFVDDHIQELVTWPVTPYVKQDGSDYVNAFGCRDIGFKSAIWWNFGASEMLAGGLPIEPNHVTMHSIDKIPCIETTDFRSVATIRGPGTTLNYTYNVSPVGGSSTPGRFELMYFDHGSWKIIANTPLDSFKSGTGTVTITSDLRLRAVLVRTGTARAMATVWLNYQLN